MSLTSNCNTHARVLVTGATGFVGSVLCETLARSGYVVRAASRSERELPSVIAEQVVVGDIHAGTDWNRALLDVDCVLHVAARAHVMDDRTDGADAYLLTNADGTRRLAEAAARAGVRRFVYMSSVKVNGEETSTSAYTAADPPAPSGNYAASKWLGEKHLAEVAGRSALEHVVVRSPLVYGPRVKANFLRLLRWVDRELPLPLGSVHNRRSLVSVWNLCDLLAHTLAHPRAAGRVWMVSDGEDLATPELVRRIARAMHRRTRLFGVPPRLLEVTGACLGRGAEVSRLTRSLMLDIAPTRSELGWSPAVSVNEALERTVDWYLRNEQLVN
jgi:nucleoside-diphosphate-sugar epimerase